MSDPLEAVLFDVDGTLVDHDGAARAGLERRLGRDPLGEDTWRRWLQVEDVYFSRYLDGELGFLEQRRARVRVFLDESLTDTQADDWYAGYLGGFEAAWRVFDDVRPTLARLRRLGVGLAAFSNVDGAYTRRKLAKTGLLGGFRVVLGRDDVERGKPAAEPFLRLAERLGIAPSRCAHVGDRYEVDARAAHAAGLLGVWLNREGADPSGREPALERAPEVVEIVSLDALPRIVTEGR